MTAAVNPADMSEAIKAIFQATLLTANEAGFTIRELAQQVGVSKSTMWDWISGARARRAANKAPRVALIEPSIAHPKLCSHPRGLIKPGRPSICILCLLSNIEDHPWVRRHPSDVPPREPRTAYRPGQLRGGRS